MKCNLAVYDRWDVILGDQVDVYRWRFSQVGRRHGKRAVKFMKA